MPSLEHVMRLRGKASLLIAMVVGYSPSFALPFVVAHVTSAENSDAILIAISTAITVGSVLSIAYENAWSASAAHEMAGGQSISICAVRKGIWQATLVGLTVTLALLPIYGLSYLINPDGSRQVILSCLISVAPFPIVASIASVFAGVLIANGDIAITVALQATRGIFPILGGVLLSMGAQVVAVGALLSLGEVVRAILLFRTVGKKFPTRDKTQSLAKGNSCGNATAHLNPIPAPRDIFHHVSGLAAMGVSPIVDRAFLNVTYVGAVTRFEMADRIFTAFSQICNNLLVMPRVPHIARSLVSLGPAETVKNETRRIGVRSTAIATAVVLALLLYILLIPQGAGVAVAVWALILIASLPAAAAGTLGTRMIVATGNSRLIPALAVVGVATNIAGNFVGIALLGATGVLLSTVFCRYLLILLTFVALRRTGSSFEPVATSSGVPDTKSPS